MENPTQPTSEHSANSAREKLRSYLGSQMKVVISDGRVLIGEFMCTDNDRNLILGNCDEYIPTNEAVEMVNRQESLSRMLSLAIIPGHHISSIAVAKGNSGNEALTDPTAMKHAQYKSQHNNHQMSQDKNQHKDQHGGEHEDHQHENHNGDQHDVNQHVDQNDDQPDDNKHENQYEDQNDDGQHEDQNDGQHEHEDQNDKKLGNINAIDAYTEEHGQTRGEDRYTPQQHLTL